MATFDHEKMEVYARALDFVGSANTLRDALVSGRSGLADQFDRAAISIALNIAEGAGEFASREKARFYRIARRSATECAAILDILRKLELASEPEVASAREEVRIIVAMLVSLAKSIEARGSS